MNQKQNNFEQRKRKPVDSSSSKNIIETDWTEPVNYIHESKFVFENVMK